MKVVLRCTVVVKFLLDHALSMDNVCINRRLFSIMEVYLWQFNTQSLISNHPNCTYINQKLNGNKPVLQMVIVQTGIKIKGLMLKHFTLDGITRKGITQEGVTLNQTKRYHATGITLKKG